VLNEQAARYGLPVGGALIDLHDVARWIHEHLAARARGRNGDDDLLAGSGSSPALERYRTARAEGEELDVAARKGALLPRRVVRAALLRLAGLLRGTVEQLDRDFGTAAATIVIEATNTFEAGIDDFCGELNEHGEALGGHDERVAD